MINVFNNIRAVLFDLDGTLVETNIDFTKMKSSIIELSRNYGIPDSIELPIDILEIINLSKSFLINSRAAIIPDEYNQSAYKILRNMEVHASQNAKIMEGAKELLSILRQSNIKICIVTRNCREASEISINKTGIIYDIMLTRDDTSDIKPNPNHLLSTISAFNISPNHAVMVGDHWIDILAGRRAGIKTVGLLHPTKNQDVFSKYQPDLIINSLHELRKALDNSKC